MLRAREDERLVQAAAPHERAQELALALAVDRQDQLADQLRGRVAGRDVHLGRPVQEAVRQLPDLVGEGRREEQVLAPPRQHREDLADVVDEPHVQHPVGLVEHEHLHRRQVDGVLADVVEQPARRGDHDLGAGPERARLGAEPDAAVDRDRPDRPARAVGPDALLHLEGKLAGRDEDERADLAPRRAAPVVGARGGRVEVLEDGQDERGGLARAGLGAGQQVAAGQDERDGRGLDGGGLGVALVRDGAEELGRQPEVIEGHVMLLAGPSRSRRGPVRAQRWSGSAA